jgi:hypothetical protein
MIRRKYSEPQITNQDVDNIRLAVQVFFAKRGQTPNGLPLPKPGQPEPGTEPIEQLEKEIRENSEKTFNSDDFPVMVGPYPH